VASGAAQQEITLPPALVAAIVQLGREEDAGPPAILLTAFATLLHRYTGQAELVIGILDEDRSQPNSVPLPIHIQIEGDPGFGALFATVRRSLLEAMGGTRVPVALRVVNGLGLTLAITCGPDDLRAAFEYSIDLFDRAAIVRMAENFCVLLEAAMAAPGISVAELPILSDSERHTTLNWSTPHAALRAMLSPRTVRDELLEDSEWHRADLRRAHPDIPGSRFTLRASWRAA
jgi:non-ribosomal peptide synthetase component F